MIRFSSYPGNGADYDRMMKAVYRLAGLDQYPFLFRKTVDFIYQNGRAVDFKMQLFTLNESELVAELRKDDLRAMKDLVANYSDPGSDQIISIY